MYKVTSFPTIKLFPKKDKKVPPSSVILRAAIVPYFGTDRGLQGAEYSGDRTEMALKEFIDKETYEAPVAPAREPPKVQPCLAIVPCRIQCSWRFQWN